MEDPSLVQLWGPRYQVYVVPKRDFALFSLARLPDDEKGRQRAQGMAERLHAHLRDQRMTDRELGSALGIGNELRYATTTGTLAIRWGGARAPVVWAVAPATIDPVDARRELARRYLHVFGPASDNRFARWAGISRRSAAGTFASLEGSLLPVRSPLGDESLLAEDEPEFRAAESVPAPARLLPSGDAYFLLLQGAEREVLVPREDQRQRLWTSRVWPGALLVNGEIRGTWRRAQHIVRVERDHPPGQRDREEERENADWDGGSEEGQQACANGDEDRTATTQPSGAEAEHGNPAELQPGHERNTDRPAA